MMQLSWIGRQVFAKFFRKNGLLGHPQQSTKPSTPSPGGGGLSSQGQSVGLCEAVQVQLLQSTGSTGGAKVESTKPVGVCPPSHHHRHRFPSQEDRWSTIPPVDSGPLCSLNIPESSGISSRIMSVSLAYPRTLQQNPWRSASSAGLSHVTRDCCSNAYSSGSWTASRRKFHTSNVLDINEINADSSVTEKVTIVEMKRFLRKQELPFVDGFTCLRLDCFLCKKASRKKKTFPWETDKLFVNKTTGYFVCIHCKISGSWRNFQDLVALSKSSHGLNKNAIELLKKDDLSSKYEDKLNDLQMNSREVCTLTDEEWGQIAMKFGIDKLKKSVLEQYEMRYSVDSQQLLLPIYNIELNRVGYSVLSLSPKSGEIETHTVPKSCKESFGWKQIFQSFSSSSAAAAKSKSVVLVQSPLDVLAIASSTSYLPLALHTGCTYLPQEFLPKLEHFDEILLWFGNDVKSWETAKSFGRKLEERRCRLIRPIDLHPAPFVALQQQELNLSKILSGAQIMEHKAITTFSKLREEVFSELSHQDKVAGVKWSRYPYLTKLLKGHRRGELTILTGSTGSGKTTFMSEYSLDLCVQGVNTLWGSFEIRNVRLAKTMLTQYSEIDLEKHINEYDKWADKFEKLPLYFMTFHGQQSIKAVLDAMTHSAYVYDIGHVIVDNLQFMLGVSDEKGSHIDRFWRQDLIVAAFRKFATLNNCHVTLVMHPRKEGNDTELSNSSIFGGAKASQEADNILILQDRRLTSPKGKKYLQVSKNRFSGDLGMFTLEFNRECLSFATKKKPKIEQSVLLKSKSTHSETKANTSDTSTEDAFNIESSVQNKT